MDKRVILRVELEPGSKENLDSFCDRTGMTKVAAGSRLIDWFCKQPESVQAIIQGLFPPPIEGDIAELILKQLAGRQNGANGFTNGNGSHPKANRLAAIARHSRKV